MHFIIPHYGTVCERILTRNDTDVFKVLIFHIPGKFSFSYCEINFQREFSTTRKSNNFH